MNLLYRVFTYSLLTIFGFFLFGLNLTVSAFESSDIFIINSSFTDTCNWNIQCEQISKDLYVCHSDGSRFSGNTKNVHNIPTGKCAGVEDVSYEKFRYLNDICYRPADEILYSGPDTFVYPFVRITKIQV